MQELCLQIKTLLWSLKFEFDNNDAIQVKRFLACFSTQPSAKWNPMENPPPWNLGAMFEFLPINLYRSSFLNY